MNKFKLNWAKMNGLIPAVIQDTNDGRVLMLGYMNKESLKKTVACGRVWFYSRSKKRLWMKGEISKNILKVVDIKCDCDCDALLIKVKPTGPACHSGAASCFGDTIGTAKFNELFEVIKRRRKEMPANSYTAFLFKKGLPKICSKIKEESSEVIAAAKNETKKRLVEESVDLLYHLFALLVYKKIDLLKITDEIGKRRKN